MKKIELILLMLLLAPLSISAQTMKEHKVGHIFNIALPNYMNKTLGLNDVASIQFKNEEKDIYGMVILDTKEELTLAEAGITSINDFYDLFIKDFLKDEENRKVSIPLNQKKGDINTMQIDVSYYDKEAKGEIYYYIGMVETKTAFYKILCWCTLANKEVFKADFDKILNSVRD